MRVGTVRLAAVALALGVGTASVALRADPGGSSVLTSRIGLQRADGEGIPTYDVVFTLRGDGTLHVREAVAYDFGDRAGSGITRTMPYRIGDRMLRITGVRASSTTGAPARTNVSRFLHQENIRVGGGVRVSGLQAYVLEYDVTGAVVRHGRTGMDELSWDAVGTGWPVPITQANIQVIVPVRPLWVTCEAGQSGLTTPCARAPLHVATDLKQEGPRRPAERVMQFTQSALDPHEGVQVRVALPRGRIKIPPPVYAKPHVLFTLWGEGVLVVAVVLAIVVVGRRPALARHRNASIVGTVTAVAGVVAVMWDICDDIVAGGLWSASVGDQTLVGLAGVVLGGAVVVSEPPGRMDDPSVSGQ